MKNKLYSIAIFIVLFLPFVAPWEGGSIVQMGQATRGNHISQESYLPVYDWDMSGLDVRDAKNRPVRDAQSTQDLTELFVQNLFSMTVVRNLHSMEQIWNGLESFSRLFHDLILNIAYAINDVMAKALGPSSKRFVHNVHNLWIVLTVGIFFCSLKLSSLLKKPSNQRLILRC